MAGSKRWFNYILDDGTVVGAQLDESNTEAINGTAANVPGAATAATRNYPSGTKLRSIYYSSTDGNRIIRCVALNATIYAGIPAANRTIPDPLNPGNTLTFLRKRPEVSRSPNFAADTGLTDGDSPG
jgi:hypothetical protein